MNLERGWNDYAANIGDVAAETPEVAAAFAAGATWAVGETAHLIDSDAGLYHRIEDLHLSASAGAADDIQDEVVKSIRALAGGPNDRAS